MMKSFMTLACVRLFGDGARDESEETFIITLYLLYFKLFNWKVRTKAKKKSKPFSGWQSGTLSAETANKFI